MGRVAKQRICEAANLRSSDIGFAAPRFSDSDRIAKQRNHASVSLLRVYLILTELQSSKTICCSRLDYN